MNYGIYEDGKMIDSGLLLTISEMNKRKIELADCLIKLSNNGITSGDAVEEIKKQYNEIMKEIEKRRRIRR